MTVVINGTTGISGVDGSAGTPAVQGSDTDTGMWFPAANTVAWSTGGSERMRVDSSGNVGIGTTSPSYKLDINAGNAASFARIATSASNNGAGLILAGAFSGQKNWVIANQYNVNGSLEFTQTTAAGGSTIGTTPSMVIDSSGNLLLNQTSGNADAKFSVFGGSTDSSPCIDFRKGSATTTTSQVYARFFCNNGSTATGSITANGVSGATFTAYSDRRLKENITDLPSQLANIMALRPVEFDYKGYTNGEGHQIGFIAQEVQHIFPDLVAEDDNGMLTLSDMNKNDARLIKAIQELKSIIDTQASTITALTARITALENK